MNPEAKIEKQFRAWCLANKYGHFRLRLNPGRGWPDCAVFLPNNQVLWVEFKTKTGRLSPIQKYVHQKIERAGHVVSVCRSAEEAIHEVTRVSDRGFEVPDRQDEES